MNKKITTIFSTVAVLVMLSSMLLSPAHATSGNLELRFFDVNLSTVTAAFTNCYFYEKDCEVDFWTGSTTNWISLVVQDSTHAFEANFAQKWEPLGQFWRYYCGWAAFVYQSGSWSTVGYGFSGTIDYESGHPSVQLTVERFGDTWYASYYYDGDGEYYGSYDFNSYWTGNTLSTGLEMLYPIEEGYQNYNGFAGAQATEYRYGGYTWYEMNIEQYYDVHDNIEDFNINRSFYPNDNTWQTFVYYW